MALNLLGNGYGNQNYSPAQSSGTVSNLVGKYGKSELKRTITTKTPGKSRTRTVTRTIAEPEMEYAKYQGPEEESATITTKSIFGTTQKQRQQYVREVEDYNKQIRAEKQKVIDYNKEVEQWNKVGRFKKVTRTYTETPTVTTTKTMTIPTGKVSVMTTPKSTGTITTKTLTSKERLDAISKPKDYLKSLADKKAEAEKPTLFKELKSQATERYLTIPRYIVTGFKKFGEAYSKKDARIVSEPLSRSVSNLKQSPPALQTKAEALGENIRTGIITTQPFRKSYVSDLYKDTRDFRTELKTPRRQAELILTGGELVLPYAISKAPQTFTTARYKLFGTRVAPETLYSPIAMKSPRGLDLTYNPEKTIKAFKKTYGKTAELPGQFVGVSQTRATDLGSKIFTRAELTAKGIKQGSEPGLFVSPKGAGQTGFLGISDDAGYQLTLDPRKAFSQGQPTTFQIGFKEVGQYPKSILKAPLSQSKLEAFQISQAPKSKALITRMSSLGTKLEPEVIIPVTSKLEKIKTPLYYTEFKGTVVPIKTVSVLGTGDAAKNLISGKSVFKGTKAYESLRAGNSRYISVSPSVLFPVRSSTVASKYKSSLSSLYPTSKISTVSKIDDDEPIIPRPKPSPSPTYKSETSTSKIVSTTTSTSSPLPAPTYTSRTLSRPSLTTNYRTPTGSRILRPIIQKDRKQKEQISGEPAYDVLIKVGNKWVNKTNGKRNVYSAMHRGADIVDNTTAKSFKIKKGTGIANIFKYNVPYNINKFYTPSKTRSAKLTGAYIEKNQFAIDTPGERKGLSVAKYLRGVKLI